MHLLRCEDKKVKLSQNSQILVIVNVVLHAITQTPQVFTT